MKKYFFAFFVMVCFLTVGNNIAQTVIDTLRLKSSTHYRVLERKYQGETDYSSSNSIGVGQRYVSSSEEDNYYTFFTFHLDDDYFSWETEILSVSLHSITSRSDVNSTILFRSTLPRLGTGYSGWIQDYVNGDYAAEIGYGDDTVQTYSERIINWFNWFYTQNDLYIGAALNYKHNDPTYIDTATIDLEIIVIYEHPVGELVYEIKNKLGDIGNYSGIIGVGVNDTATAVTSPHQIEPDRGDIINLKAYTNSVNNTTYIFNEISGNVDKSNWNATYKGNQVQLSDYTDASFMARLNYGPNVYVKLKPAWQIALPYTTEFNDVYTQNEYIAKGNTVPITAPLNKTINTKLYQFAGWLDNSSTSNVRTLTPTGNTTITPRYKYATHSNQANGYSSNSQRKVIKTTVDGYLHNVYQSMGKVWYEKSTNNGVTWQLMNNGFPLSNADSKNPSFLVNGETDVIIAFQEKCNVTDYQIKIIMFNSATNSIGSFSTITTNKPYTDECHPVLSIAWYPATRYILLAWEEKEYTEFFPGGIYYRFGMFNAQGTQIEWNAASLIMPNTNGTCLNPTLMGSSNYPPVFQIAYQQNPVANSSKIWYDSAAVVNNVVTFPRNRMELSVGSGYTKNYNPSIIEINRGARVVWVGEREGDSPEKATTTTGTGVNVLYKPTEVIEKNVVFKSPHYSRFWYFGSNVQGPTITKSANNLYYNIAWNETTTNNNKFADNTLSTIRNFNMSGNYVQVANGPAKADMLGIVFDARTAPYVFNKTGILTSYAKENTSALSINFGRQGLVKKDNLQFYFALGDIIVNEQSVGFTNVPEEFAVTNLETLNGMLISEPFIINDGENFIYSVQYGLVGNGVQEFPADKYINFKVKMIDANTGELLRVFDNVTYSTGNMEQYNNLVYQVNVSGIGNKTVKLCLEVSDNLEAEYFAADRLTDEDILAKANIQQVELNETVVIKDYDLFQNYPNPFNPSTTISFQMPKDGFVTLKIYDILGKEITTLVNEFKTTGKYNVQFNASNLASGMYIYQIKVGDYSNTKKLMLMK
ncbi:MAG: T9SS type A sorting domain-containing protein [bacterium]